MKQEPKKKKPASAALSGANYYYANGQRIALEPATDLLAIDDAAFRRAKIPAPIRAAVKKAAKPLTSGVCLLNRSALDDETIKHVLEAAGVLQPVYRASGAVIVALPEVRVEEAPESSKQRGLKKWLANIKASAAVEYQSDGRFTIRPMSGYGGDALAIANSLAEDVKPDLAQAHFIRVVQRPGTTTRKK